MIDLKKLIKCKEELKKAIGILAFSGQNVPAYAFGTLGCGNTCTGTCSNTCENSCEGHCTGSGCSFLS